MGVMSISAATVKPTAAVEFKIGWGAVGEQFATALFEVEPQLREIIERQEVSIEPLKKAFAMVFQYTTAVQSVRLVGKADFRSSMTDETRGAILKDQSIADNRVTLRVILHKNFYVDLRLELSPPGVLARSVVQMNDGVRDYAPEPEVNALLKADQERFDRQTEALKDLLIEYSATTLEDYVLVALEAFLKSVRESKVNGKRRTAFSRARIAQVLTRSYKEICPTVTAGEKAAEQLIEKGLVQSVERKHSKHTPSNLITFTPAGTQRLLELRK